MFAAHLLETTAFDWSHPATWTDVVNGRSSILFATLAGVSLALVTGGTRPFSGERMTYARIRIALRAACIWVLGIALVLLGTPVLVILPAYAILFLLALPLLALSPSRLFAIAATIAVLMPFAVYAIGEWPGWDDELGQGIAQVIGWNYPFLLWAAFVVAGIAVGRIAFSRPAVAGALAAAGAALAAVGYGVVGQWAQLSQADSLWGVVLSSGAHSSGIGEAIGSGGTALATIGLCALLCVTPLRWVVLPLRAVGAMALTAYTVQLVVWAALQPPAGAYGSPLASFRALEPFWPMTLATIAGCTLWTLLVGRGPLEWLIGRVASVGPPPKVDARA
ncbi:DUF418 domain-containing protein [Microbacterium marinilacus]|nr:DUF418 domain-containing protein [Microbacterium marinilacus]